MSMKKTIGHLATLMAAALAAHCLFEPSAPDRTVGVSPTGAAPDRTVAASATGAAPDRTVAASATGAVTALSEAQDATRSAIVGSGPRSRSLSVPASPIDSAGRAQRRFEGFINAILTKEFYHNADEGNEGMIKSNDETKMLVCRGGRDGTGAAALASAGRRDADGTVEEGRDFSCNLGASSAYSV